MVDFTSAMTFSTAEIVSYIGGYFWPFVRIGAMLMVVPIFGAQKIVPVRIRLGLALALTWIVAPMLPPMPAVDPLSLDGLLITVQQLLLGVAMGTILSFIFSALVVGGHSIAMSMGLGFAQFLDPNGISVPVVSSFYLIIGTLLYLSLNGHLVSIQVLVSSFKTIPVSTIGLAPDSYFTIVLWASKIFVGAILIALPILITIMLINAGFGVMMRAAPTLNIFAVGFPVTMMAGFLLILLTLPTLLPRFTDMMMQSFDFIEVLVSAGSP